MKKFLPMIIATLTSMATFGQLNNDDRILLQGFYWEASHDFNGDWYEEVEALVPDMKSTGIDMIWLPPPSDAGAWEGYLPRELNNFSNYYGTLAEHQSLLTTLGDQGIEAIADIVINHRVGSTNWVDFTNPTWGTNSITADDEVWSNPDYSSIGLRGNYDTGTPYAAARDVDHTQTFVQDDIKAFLTNLKNLGYDGWRYDFVHGFDEYYIQLYNGHSNPTFSVGENWNSDKQVIQDWIDNSGSTAFDFPTYYALKGVIRDNNYSYLAYQGAAAGGIGWDPRNYTTFIENHDTPEYDPTNNILTGSNVGQAYAYLLTHPGIPCIFWDHLYRWGNTVHDEIAALAQIRKDAGIHSQSALTIHRSEAGLYVASITGDNKTVYLKMGYSSWGDPANEGMGGSWDLAAYGTNYAVWTEAAPVSSGSMTVYVQGYTHAYAWDDNQNALLGAWPGTALSPGPNGFSQIDIPADCANIIFSNAGAGQTADLNTCNTAPYYYGGSWHASEPTSGGGSMTVYVQGYTHVYAWDDNQNALLGAWPGVALSSGSGGWLQATISANCANLIFSNNGAEQTADLNTCATTPYYQNGTWYASEPTSTDLTVYVQGYTHFYAWDDDLNALAGAWPGTALSADGNGWMTGTVSANCANVIFSNNGANQTADLSTCAPNGYYFNNGWHSAAGARIDEEQVLISTYPNPFVYETNVYFQLQNKSLVRLEVFNAAGQQITLFDQAMSIGEHQISIHRNQLPPATGIYFMKLIVDGVTHTRKLILR